jgi:hypothetical protein
MEYYNVPQVSHHVDYEYVVAFGPGSHHELVIRELDFWIVFAEPESREGLTEFYRKHLSPHLATLSAQVPAPVAELLKGLAAGKSRRELRKAALEAAGS